MLGILLLVTPQTQPKSWSFVSKIAVTAVAGFTIGKVVYNTAMNYLENKIVDETVHALYAGITFSNSIKNMSPSDREQALRQRAWLLNIRKRVTAALHARIDQGKLTMHHARALKTHLLKIESFLGALDYVTAENEYEHEYVNPTYVDSLIEHLIIRSILLQTKPDHECTVQELAKKEEMKKRKDIITHKLKDQLYANACDKVLESMGMIVDLVKKVPLI